MKNSFRIISEKMLHYQSGGLIALMLIVYAVPVVAGDPLSFIGNWNYRESGGGYGRELPFQPHIYTDLFQGIVRSHGLLSFGSLQ